MKKTMYLVEYKNTKRSNWREHDMFHSTDNLFSIDEFMATEYNAKSTKTDWGAGYYYYRNENTNEFFRVNVIRCN